MFTFALGAWDNIWRLQGSLGDRLRGIIFVLLVLSASWLLLGAIAAVLSPRDKRATTATGRERWIAALTDNVPVSAGATVICSLLLGLLGLERSLRWAGAAAALPAFLVLLQYVYLYAHKPRRTEDRPTDVPSQEDRASKAVESNYGPRALFIRYGFPAIVLLIEGQVLVFALVHPAKFLGFGSELLTAGAQYGAIGAYTWVLLELGRRSFRRDVTGGLALWAIVTLAVGPMLAAVLALVWKLKPSTDGWQSAVVLFYAGYAPRNVLKTLTAAASALLRAESEPNVETRTTPLTRIRGINRQIEERLGEEGIDNVEGLAAVEPIRLLRDTPFDLRAMLWWIDEALLMMYVPTRWQLLQDQGITGAIDMADLATKASHNDDSAQASLLALAKAVNVAPAELLALFGRVQQDSQVQYVWWLYNVYITDGHDAPS